MIRYIPSGKYYARIRISGKLIRKSLKTASIAVAKLRLSDLEKAERQKAEHRVEAVDGRLPLNKRGDLQGAVEGDASRKQRTKDYHGERLVALHKSWPKLKSTEIRKIRKPTA